LDGTETVLTVRTPHYESKLNGIAAEEFPTVPQVEGEPVLRLDSSMMRDALVQVAIAASAAEARPVLAGVYMYTEDSTLVMVATDSYRLAEKRLELSEAPAESLAVIVPVRTIQELVRLLGETEGDLELYLEESQVMFRLGEVELVSRLIEGQYPSYRQIVPKQAETTFEVDAAEFGRIVKVASLFAREAAGSVRLEIKAEGEVRVVSSDSEVGGNTSPAECEVSGDDGEISLNARYLQDALSVLKVPRIRFAISGKLNPCVLTAGDDEAADDYFHIVMPLRT
ncbi:MAG TPA: DNA polymerase III subunit beta, partial [Candidatus Saccharimonas sp.]|nr:DNA polymerase III subunit beta [Candidatus Saccharimonas sp.]